MMLFLRKPLTVDNEWDSTRSIDWRRWTYKVVGLMPIAKWLQQHSRFPRMDSGVYQSSNGPRKQPHGIETNMNNYFSIY